MSQYQATNNSENHVAPPADQPREKDFENGAGGYHEHLHENMDPDTALRKVQTAGSISISPELFEKIYLSPQNRVAGDLRKTFGNPTPLALGGFLLSLSPLSCILMGWRGAGNNGASDIGPYLAFGGILMTLGAIGEWILGNTFPFVVFGTFGAFWISFGLTLYPYMGSFSDFAGLPSPTGVATQNGLKTVAFNASFAFFLLFMGVLCFVYAICALRTNLCFFLILLLLVPSFGALAGAFWYTAKGEAGTANTLLITGGALTFVVDMIGWYLFTAIMLASLDFPFTLPVFDLSHLIKGASDRAKAKGE